MTTAEILERLANYEDEVLKADGFDDAIIGLAEGWFGNSHHCVVCYDYQKCLEILESQGLSVEDAEEWLSFNTLGAYVGQFTPIFIYNWRAEPGP
jgi:hypothetical protein